MNMLSCMLLLMERIQKNEKHVQKLIVVEMKLLGRISGNMLREMIRLSAYVRSKKFVPLKIT